MLPRMFLASWWYEEGCQLAWHESPRDRVKCPQKHENGGSETPQFVARTDLCCPEQSLATSAAGSRVGVGVGEGHEPNMSKHAHTHYRR